MKIKQIRPEFVEFIPEQLEDGVLYISARYSTAVHRCCCGCGQEVVTPLSPAEWSVTSHGSRVSMWPSIGNWSYPCRSHYVIRNGRVLGADGLSEQQIRRVKTNDRTAKIAHIHQINRAKAKQPQDLRSNKRATSAPDGPTNSTWLQRFMHWWKSS